MGFECGGVTFENGRKFDHEGLEIQIYYEIRRDVWGFQTSTPTHMVGVDVLRGQPSEDDDMSGYVMQRLSDLLSEARALHERHKSNG